MHRTQFRNDSRWQSRIVGQLSLRPWLQERGSLTARLKRKYPDFSVQILSQAWRKPNLDEQALLHLPASTRAWVREVMLMGQGQPQVFAHSVISRKDLRGAWHGLRSIGRVPLGASLFADARVSRGCLHYLKLPTKHPLRQALCCYFPVARPQPLWARRSLFSLRHYRLLVTEVFLPACVNQPSHNYLSGTSAYAIAR